MFTFSHVFLRAFVCLMPSLEILSCKFFRFILIFHFEDRTVLDIGDGAIKWEFLGAAMMA